MSHSSLPLAAKISSREARIGIVGLGYVGLPLAIVFGEAGFSVVGVDRDRTRTEMVSRGESYIRHISSSSLKALVESRKLSAEIDVCDAGDVDCWIICVPTPLTSAREPDMSHIVETGIALASYVRHGQLFVLESTTYPGTTEEILKPLLERSGLRAGLDFHLAFSPEREDPGNKTFGTKSIPKIVGGFTSECGRLAAALYGAAVTRVVPVSSTRVAELAKLLENIFRCVNIALVNELKMLCDRMGIDIWEVTQAAATKPFGFMSFAPGPGLGGHCIPIDPFYLTWKARQYEFQTKFIELAGEVNSQMPYYVVQRTMETLNTLSLSVNGSRLLILGAAYKKDVDDTRESPALRVMHLLRERGASIDYHDPFVGSVRIGPGEGALMVSVPLSKESVSTYDAVLILTDHSNVDYQMVVANARLVIDTRNATRGHGAGDGRVTTA